MTGAVCVRAGDLAITRSSEARPSLRAHALAGCERIRCGIIGAPHSEVAHDDHRRPAPSESRTAACGASRRPASRHPRGDSRDRDPQSAMRIASTRLPCWRGCVIRVTRPGASPAALSRCDPSLLSRARPALLGRGGRAPDRPHQPGAPPALVPVRSVARSLPQLPRPRDPPRDPASSALARERTRRRRARGPRASRGPVRAPGRTALGPRFGAIIICGRRSPRCARRRVVRTSGRWRTRRACGTCGVPRDRSTSERSASTGCLRKWRAADRGSCTVPGSRACAARSC